MGIFKVEIILVLIQIFIVPRTGINSKTNCWHTTFYGMLVSMIAIACKLHSIKVSQPSRSPLTENYLLNNCFYFITLTRLSRKIDAEEQSLICSFVQVSFFFLNKNSTICHQSGNAVLYYEMIQIILTVK